MTKIKKINIVLLLFLFINFFISKITLAEVLEYELTAIKITYNDSKDLITAIGDAIAKDSNGRTITSPKIIYDKKNKIIKTFSNSVFYDDKNNKILADNFIYDLEKKKISALKNVKYTDKENNIYLFDEFIYFEIQEKGYGKNLKATNIDGSKIKAIVSTIDNKTSNTIFEKGGNYTTCDFNFATTNYLFNKLNTIKECPDWEIVSKKTRHNKKEKMIYHDHPILKLKGIPVFYTPYFSHPDPSVKRKSGFLTPSSLNNESYGRNAKIPYFYAIDNDEDFTFTPIIYFDENPIFLGEYRKVSQNSNLIIDASYTSGFKKNRQQQTNGSRNHFFLDYIEDFDNLFFSKNTLKFKIQRISQKNYIKSHEIYTPFVNPDIRYLNNEFKISSFAGNQSLSIYSRIYENLRDANNSTKYQYTLPGINYSNFFNLFNNDINFNSEFYATNYGGDSNKVQIANNITSQSDQKIIKSIGIGNYFKTAFYNIDKYNENILNEKKNFNVENYLTLASDLSLPLYKTNSDLSIEQTLEPRMLFKYTPGSMQQNNSGRGFGFGDVYSMNRINDVANPETGFSIGHGLTWELSKKNSNFEKYLYANASIGQVLRFNELQEMPSRSSLNQKSSNIVVDTSILMNKNKFIDDEKNGTKIDLLNSNYTNLGYGFTIDNDGKDFLGHSISLQQNYKSNYLETSYAENRKNLGSSRVGKISYKKYISEQFSLNVGARKNFITHATETNTFGAIYENDCIKVSATLDKKFYNDEDIKPTNNFFFEIVLKPFGENIAPDISPLLKID